MKFLSENYKSSILTEPVNPGHLITNKHFYLEKTLREKILGTRDTNIYVSKNVKRKINKILE